VSQAGITAAHCINPNCPRPYPQNIGNKFCSDCGSSLRLLNRYIPLQKLGSGGFAAIYTVWDEKRRKEQVLKVLLDASPKALSLFEQEATVLASLHHPGVPKVEPNSYFQVTVGSSPQLVLPCLVMEKITGQTLEDILKYYSQGCPEAWVQNWLKQAVYILRELHQRQIIHRDIKPSNLMLREGTDQLVVIDFGGAKQIGDKKVNYQMSSTRLFSPGYSPPEQIAGASVGPSVDFYALGMTCIHLLTGQYPLDMEDPKTGELRWQQSAKVSPDFAALLDDMVQPNAEQRPTNTNELLARLRIISSKSLTSNLTAALFQLISKLPQNLFKLSLATLGLIPKLIGQSIFLFWRLIAHLINAVFSTFWVMLLGGIGAVFGAIIGFGLAYYFPITRQFNLVFSYGITQVIPPFTIFLKPGIILFTIAGLGTVCGLRLAGRLHQQKRYLMPAVMGIFSYGLGWFIVQKAASNAVAGPDEIVLMTAISAFLLTLGLGLPSHNIVYAIVTAAGTASTFEGLCNLLMQTAIFGFSNSFFESFDWTSFGFSLGFFSIMGIIIGFWLCVSHFLVVPFLRSLGWR